MSHFSRPPANVVHDQQPLHGHCLQVPSHVEQRLLELERGKRSEHMGQERRMDQQAGVSDKLHEVMLPFTHSMSLLTPSYAHNYRDMTAHPLMCENGTVT